MGLLQEQHIRTDLFLNATFMWFERIYLINQPLWYLQPAWFPADNNFQTVPTFNIFHRDCSFSGRSTEYPEQPWHFLEKHFAAEFFKCHLEQTKFLWTPFVQTWWLKPHTHTHTHTHTRLMSNKMWRTHTGKWCQRWNIVSCYFSVSLPRASVWRADPLFPCSTFITDSRALHVSLLMNFHPNSFLSSITELLCADYIKSSSSSFCVPPVVM